MFTPFIGGNFGGSANISGIGEDFDDEFERKINYGASLGWMGARRLGFEVDFGYSPNFFGSAPTTPSFDSIGDSNVTTLMGELIVGAPLGGRASLRVRRRRLDHGSSVDDVERLLRRTDSNDFGFDVGGGVMGFFSRQRRHPR